MNTNQNQKKWKQSRKPIIKKKVKKEQWLYEPIIFYGLPFSHKKYKTSK